MELLHLFLLHNVALNNVLYTMHHCLSCHTNCILVCIWIVQNNWQGRGNSKKGGLQLIGHKIIICVSTSSYLKPVFAIHYSFFPFKCLTRTPILLFLYIILICYISVHYMWTYDNLVTFRHMLHWNYTCTRTIIVTRAFTWT